MEKSSLIQTIKLILNITLICMIGCIGIVFLVLYVESFDSGFFYDFRVLIKALSVSIISIITILNIIFLRNKTGILYKLALIVNALIAFFILVIYLFKMSGLMDKINSVEQFRAFISSYGSFAVILFILLQFSQVVLLPIPAFVTVGAGVLLFGPFYGSIYSCIGIISGSLVGYFLGHVFGVKVVRWVIGKDSLEKGLNIIKGKDKIILTFMFLFPFFPDDVLCFVAGITTIGPAYFTSMIIIVRIITIFAQSYSFNNSIIPYDTWWGIIIWIVFFVISILLAFYVYKHGDKIENKIKSIFSRKNKGK